MFSDFLPPSNILLLFVVFGIFRFENQRWIRSIAGGNRGTSEMMALFVNLTGFLGLIVGIGATIFLIWNAGWMIGIGTLVATVLAGFLASILLTIVFRGDSFLIWFLSTIALWPTGYFLIAALSKSNL